MRRAKRHRAIEAICYEQGKQSTNLFIGLLEGFLFEAQGCLSCLLEIDARLNQT